MNDRRVPDPLDDEQLSAYLLGDLSAADAAALERQLADDPQRAARLNALGEALALLGGVDDASPPDGFEQRLAQRLEGGAQIVDLDQERRARRTQWMAGVAAAAVVVFGAVFAPSMLGGTDNSAVTSMADSAGSEAAAGPPAGPVLVDSEVAIADEMALRQRYSDLPEVAALLGTDAEAAAALAQEYTAAVPSSLAQYAAVEQDAAQQNATADGAEAPTADDVRAEEGTDRDYAEGKSTPLSGSSDPEAGTGPAGAAVPAPTTPIKEGAESFTRHKLRGTASSARGDARATLHSCLKEISADATQPLVPARIETLRYAGRRAFAYVLVTASPDSPLLDRTELWVVSRVDCSTLVFQQY